MNDISQLSTGMSKEGMKVYIEHLRAELLTSTSDLINDVAEIETTLNAAWQGVAKDRFLEQFAAARESVINDLTLEYNQLCYRLEELQDTYLKADANMIEN